MPIKKVNKQINKQINKQVKKEYKNCVHNYIKTEGIISCSKCDKKAILYLSRLIK